MHTLLVLALRKTSTEVLRSSSSWAGKSLASKPIQNLLVVLSYRTEQLESEELICTEKCLFFFSFFRVSSQWHCGYYCSETGKTCRPGYQPPSVKWQKLQAKPSNREDCNFQIQCEYMWNKKKSECLVIWSLLFIGIGLVLELPEAESWVEAAKGHNS